MQIKIETTFLPLIHCDDPLPDGIKKTIIPTVEKRSIDYQAMAAAIFHFGKDVAVEVFAAWIYEKIKRIKDNPQMKLKINEKIITKITEGMRSPPWFGRKSSGS